MALFTSMSACGNTDVKTCCPSQLSARWTFLASVFQSLGYLDEALLATAGALSCAVTSANELGGENEMTTVSLLNLLASKSYGVFSPFVDTCSLGDEQTRVLIRRLLKNTLEKGVSISLDSPGPFSASQAIQMLRKRMLSRYKKATGSTDVINSNFSLKGEDGFLSLLRSIVGIDFKSSTQTISKIDLVISTVDILGQMIQQRCASDGGIPDNYGLMYEGALGVLMQVVEEMLVCNDIVTEESATAERAVESDIVRFTFRGMIHAIGSSCLLSRSPFLPAVVTGISEATNVVSAEKISSPLHTFACRYLEKSWEAIERETMAETEWACIFSAVRLAIAFCQSNLSVLMNVEDAINSNRSSIVLGAVDEHSIHLLSSNATSSEMLHFCRGCMTWILSRIRDQFSFEGERLLASQLAAWHNSIARYSDEAEERWASSLTSTLLLSGGLLQVASELCAGEEEEISFDRESALETLVELAEAERRIGRCRIELFRTLPGLTSVRSIDEQLGRLKNDVNALGSTFAHSIIAVLQCWVQASALFAISEAAELICDMERAFSCVRSCFQMCQEVACQVNGQKSESSSDMSGLRWIAHLLPTIRLKAREKQIDCLRRTAALYAKIGDHRRTEAYSISALKNSLILPKESMPKAKIKLNELLLLFRSQGTDTIQEQISRRLLLQYKAMSSPHDLVIKEFNDEDSAALIGPQQSQGFSALVSVEDLLSGKSNNVDQRLFITKLSSHP